MLNPVELMVKLPILDRVPLAMLLWGVSLVVPWKVSASSVIGVPLDPQLPEVPQLLSAPPPFHVRVLVARAVVPIHDTQTIRKPMVAIFRLPSLRLCRRPSTLQGAFIFIISSEPIVLT